MASTPTPLRLFTEPPPFNPSAPDPVEWLAVSYESKGSAYLLISGEQSAPNAGFHIYRVDANLNPLTGAPLVLRGPPGTILRLPDPGYYIVERLHSTHPASIEFYDGLPPDHDQPPTPRPTPPNPTNPTNPFIFTWAGVVEVMQFPGFSERGYKPVPTMYEGYNGELTRSYNFIRQTKPVAQFDEDPDNASFRLVGITPPLEYMRLSSDGNSQAEEVYEVIHERNVVRTRIHRIKITNHNFDPIALALHCPYGGTPTYRAWIELAEIPPGQTVEMDFSHMMKYNIVEFPVEWDDLALLIEPAVFDYQPNGPVIGMEVNYELFPVSFAHIHAPIPE